MKRVPRIVKYVGLWILGASSAAILIFMFPYLAALTFGRTVQTLESPDQKHTAVLLRKQNLADFNFIVRVDGEMVYESPDLCGGGDREYRETLLWDRSGQVVVLELMGKRVSAYNANDRVSLGKGELREYKFYPMPGDLACAILDDVDQ